ncbi:MAG: hypothetical protein IT382_25155 [Deltaproteobacteria bacterium]|nr:hypothetical protein [Deltaproteobacteria bacterium]
MILLAAPLLLALASAGPPAAAPAAALPVLALETAPDEKDMRSLNEALLSRKQHPLAPPVSSPLA